MSLLINALNTVKNTIADLYFILYFSVILTVHHMLLNSLIYMVHIGGSSSKSPKGDNVSKGIFNNCCDDDTYVISPLLFPHRKNSSSLLGGNAELFLQVDVVVSVAKKL